ncbi:hypothetical protein [Chitinimonas taiwanensis]|uniref:hypothetical protein n=1 Tax=Chitinimonas taiwanensis TaxID=240412 RepID=UPI00093111DB|nr:hypothetical protein [Chitinimonas taiwanensis]
MRPKHRMQAAGEIARTVSIQGTWLEPVRKDDAIRQAMSDVQEQVLQLRFGQLIGIRIDFC